VLANLCKLSIHNKPRWCYNARLIFFTLGTPFTGLGKGLTKKTPGNQNLEQGLPVAPVVELVTSYIQELGQRLWNQHNHMSAVSIDNCQKRLRPSRIRIWICETVPLIYVVAIKTLIKNKFFLRFSCLLLTIVTFSSICKDNNYLRSHKKSAFFFAGWLKDPDPDPYK